jgi:hypothetical protein
MQKWEYEWAKESLIQQRGVGEYLKVMGEMGWELTSVVHDSSGLVYFFKRPKP